MKKTLWTALLLCLALLLSGCGAPTTDPEETDYFGDTSESPADPGDLGDPALFADLVGEWYAETNDSTLTIYENGGFHLEDSIGPHDGYLVFTETDSVTGEEGPRYEMFLENNKRMEDDAFLALLEEGLLSCTRGGFPQNYIRDPIRSSDENLAVTVQRYGERELTEYDTFNPEGIESEVVFTALRPVEHFTVLALTMEDVAEDGTIRFAMEERHTQEILDPARPLLVGMNFYGDIPNNGISYVDEDGQEHRFVVDLSGEDGSLQMWEF